MATIKFSIIVSGGKGNLHIHVVNSATHQDIDLNQSTTSQTINLPPGLYFAVAAGNVPNSPGGKIDLSITVTSGSISLSPPALDHNFKGPGPISPFSFSFSVGDPKSKGNTK